MAKDARGHGSNGRGGKIQVSVTRPIGYRIADIGPGGRESNVQTNHAWDQQHPALSMAAAHGIPTGHLRSFPMPSVPYRE